MVTVFTVMYIEARVFNNVQNGAKPGVLCAYHLFAPLSPWAGKPDGFDSILNKRHAPRVENLTWPLI